jgi:hypothetical protein
MATLDPEEPRLKGWWLNPLTLSGRRGHSLMYGSTDCYCAACFVSTEEIIMVCPMCLLAVCRECWMGNNALQHMAGYGRTIKVKFRRSDRDGDTDRDGFMEWDGILGCCQLEE